MTNPKKDSDVTNDVKEGESSWGPFGVKGDWDGYGGSGSVTAGGADVIRVDPTKDVPVVSDGVAIKVSIDKMRNGDADWSELFNISGSAAAIGLNAVTYFADPLNFLITAGLTFLIDIVQPLEDLLGLVTGNPERMEGEVGKWERVGNALGPLAEEIRQAARDDLIGWEGKTADVARKRLEEFADGVAGIGNDVKQLTMIMNIAKVVMEAAQAFIIGLISTFIEWLVYTWTAALAAAVPTAGASTAAAGAATTVQASLATSRAATFITKIVNILKRLQGVLKKMHPRIMRRVQTNFQRRGPGGQFMKGWNTPGHMFKDMVTDWRTWAPAGGKLLTAGANAGKSGADYGKDPHQYSDEELDQKLDPNR
ncbi:hypothetical protein [Longispora albida]|uniref:hypothetical protein n=1 Tax=Longispora albida TaxID=203523 RepID=UPI0003AA2BBA|nr:hypothetical protein [Longispora albida]